jgi:hypothetical protein
MTCPLVALTASDFTAMRRSATIRSQADTARTTAPEVNVTRTSTEARAGSDGTRTAFESRSRR